MRTILIAEEHSDSSMKLAGVLNQDPECRAITFKVLGAPVRIPGGGAKADFLVVSPRFFTSAHMTAISRVKSPALATIILCDRPDENEALVLLRNGASAYAVADEGYAEVREAIRVVASGRKFISPRVQGPLAFRYLDELAISDPS